jgi:hypothetical protein
VKKGEAFLNFLILSPSGCPTEVDSLCSEMNTTLKKILSTALKLLRPQNESQRGPAMQTEFHFDVPGHAIPLIPESSKKIHLNLAEKDSARLLGILEEALASAPQDLTIELIGPGILLHDNALMLFEELRNRHSHTRLHIRARTCLIDGAVLLWLAGDTRSMRSDGWIQVSAMQVAPASSGGGIDDVSILIEDEEPANTDLRSIHRHINEWLPVQEIAGLRLFEAELREFGMLDDAESSKQLAALFHANAADSPRVEKPAQDPERIPR